jgi:hypothetical protein
MYTRIENNIFHELNKMMVRLCQEKMDVNWPPYKKFTKNDRMEFYLHFPVRVREHMAELLGTSSKTLSRIYEQPIKLLDDFAMTNRLASFLSYSYPELIQILYKEESTSIPLREKSSSILNEIVKFEHALSKEDIRNIARVLYLVLSIGIPVKDFVEVNNKLINHKCYKHENLNRVYNFIEHI